MGKAYEDGDEDEIGITEQQAQRIVDWVIEHGHTEAEAYEALAAVLGVDVKKYG